MIYPTSFVAMGIAALAIGGLVIGLAMMSLGSGALETLIGKPKVRLLRSKKGRHGFAFAFTWNAAKEPAKMDTLKLRLFNPFGKPTQVEVKQSFPVERSSFAMDLDMGPGLVDFFGAKGFERAQVEIEVGSSLDGVTFLFEMPAQKLKSLMEKAKETVSDLESAQPAQTKSMKHFIEIPERSFIADSAPVGAVQLAIATNPIFSAAFGGGGGAVAPSAGASTAAAPVNYNVAKVWIEPGCIVCNACEDIYPQVFEVLADTCIIRPNPPLDDGLKIQEAAEACPVEVIKFTKAS